MQGLRIPAPQISEAGVARIGDSNQLCADLEHAAGSGAGRVTSPARSAPLAARSGALVTRGEMLSRTEGRSRWR